MLDRTKMMVLRDPQTNDCLHLSLSAGGERIPHMAVAVAGQKTAPGTVKEQGMESESEIDRVKHRWEMTFYDYRRQ